MGNGYILKFIKFICCDLSNPTGRKIFFGPTAPKKASECEAARKALYFLAERDLLQPLGVLSDPQPVPLPPHPAMFHAAGQGAFGFEPSILTEQDTIICGPYEMNRGQLELKSKVVINEFCMRQFNRTAKFNCRPLPDPLGSLPGFFSQCIIPGWPHRTDFTASSYGKRSLSELVACYKALRAVLDEVCRPLL
jgi:hypothetical protein